MKKAKDEDVENAIPGDDDENVGEGAPKKKKRKKTKEEKVSERRAIFWTLIVVWVITMAFWLVPVIGNVFQPESWKKKSDEKKEFNSLPVKSENNNYVEIVL